MRKDIKILFVLLFGLGVSMLVNQVKHAISQGNEAIFTSGFEEVVVIDIDGVIILCEEWVPVDSHTRPVTIFCTTMP